MDDVTKKMIERTKARREALQQKMMDCNPQLQRKRRPLSENNEEEKSMEITQLNKISKKEVGNITSESPNKRTRVDEEDDQENVCLDKEEAKPAEKEASTIQQRMKKILYQRKVWEAEDEGESSIDYTNVPSPIRHEPKLDTAAAKGASSYVNARKERFAKLASTINNWEDDITHHDIPKTSEVIEESVNEAEVEETKTEIDTSHTVHEPVVSKPVQTPVRQVATTPTKRVQKQTSSECLDLNSLAQFAVVPKRGKTPQKNEKNLSRKPPTGIIRQMSDNNANSNIHIVTTGKVDKSEEINSKSLMERMKELQQNGIKARPISLSTSSANDFMDRARRERMQEIASLKGNQSFDIQKIKRNILEPNSRKHEVEEVNSTAVEDEKMTIEQVNKQNENEDKLSSDKETKEDEQDDMNVETSNHAEEEEQDEIMVDEPLKEEDDPITPPQLETNNSAAYGSLMLEGALYTTPQSCMRMSYLSEDESRDISAIVHDLSKVSDLVDTKEATPKADEPYSESFSDGEEEGLEVESGIDDLFDGVLSEEEDVDDEDDLLAAPRPASPLVIPNLSRQKSRKEIRTELSFRNQTCNEAEDTHEIQQPSKFQRACLSKSNSTESIVSFCQEPYYTIDSYRTEMRKSQRTPVQKKVVRKEVVPEKLPKQPQVTVKERISRMMTEVSNLQRVIQQASAALNCCYDPKHGKGTNHEVEAEKLLLITSEKRLALLCEIQQLKNTSKQPSPVAANEHACHGTLVLDRFRLPLRTEYIFSMAKEPDVRNHYYFVLIRNGPNHMYATELVSTSEHLSGDSLVFGDKFIIKNLTSDFNVTIEVYSLNHRNRPDGMPLHDQKSKGKFSGILQKSLTPRKLRSSKRSSQMPTMMSPGGPNAIRISSFSMIGTTTLSLRDIATKKFTLQKVPFLSPISGQLMCQVNCNYKSNIEQRGFLTMFDDVGGLGAWHRRWCALQGGILYSWTYPDDENKKPAHLKLALRECISKSIATVDRLMCARPNTFELRTMRPRKQGDKQNLISQDTGSVITTKHWLSADTKDEKNAWIESLNQSLADVRAWDTESLKPFKQ